MLWLFSQFIGNEELYRSFGLPIYEPYHWSSTHLLIERFEDTENATIIGLMLFASVYSPIAHATGLLMTMWSRKCEFEADEFAVNLGYAQYLRSGLIKLQEENLGTMVPDWLYSSYHHSHPPLIQRLAAIDSGAKALAKAA